MLYIGIICIQLLTPLITRSCINRIQLFSLAEIAWTLILLPDVLLIRLCLAAVSSPEEGPAKQEHLQSMFSTRRF